MIFQIVRSTTNQIWCHAKSVGWGGTRPGEHAQGGPIVEISSLLLRDNWMKLYGSSIVYETSSQKMGYNDVIIMFVIVWDMFFKTGMWCLYVMVCNQYIQSTFESNPVHETNPRDVADSE